MYKQQACDFRILHLNVYTIMYVARSKFLSNAFEEEKRSETEDGLILYRNDVN